MSAGAFVLAALLCGSIMTWGFLTFGAASQGLILNNYATSDPLAFIARLGIGCSIIFSYPINFIGLREGVLGLLGATGESDTTHVVSTVLLLAVACGIASEHTSLLKLSLPEQFAEHGLACPAEHAAHKGRAVVD